MTVFVEADWVAVSVLVEAGAVAENIEENVRISLGTSLKKSYKTDLCL